MKIYDIVTSTITKLFCNFRLLVPWNYLFLLHFVTMAKNLNIIGFMTNKSENFIFWKYFFISFLQQTQIDETYKTIKTL